ncbi:MAG: phage tail tape measure protein [Clostridia bacterium]|nr:phage tail tape measure protein [Clostridia bacterium]
MADLGSIMVRIGADVSGLNQAARQFEKTGAALETIKSSAETATRAVEQTASRTAKAAQASAQAATSAASKAASEMQKVRVQIGREMVDLTIDPSGIVGQQLAALGVLESQAAQTAAAVTTSTTQAVEKAATSVAQSVSQTQAAIANSGQLADAAWADYAASYGLVDTASKDAAQSAKQAAGETAKAADDAGKEIKNTAKETATEVGKAADQISAKAQNGLQTLHDGLKKAGDSLNKFSNSWNKYISGPLILAGTLAVRSSMVIDDALDNIAIRTGATGQKLIGLENTFRRLATTTPAGLGDISAAVGDLSARLNMEGGPALDRLARQAVLTGKMFGENPKQVSGSFARMVQSWGVAEQDYSSTMDRMFKAAQMSTGSVTELNAALFDAGPQFRQLGYDLSSATALLVSFYQHGVDVSDATMGFKSAINELTSQGLDPKREFPKWIEGIRQARTEQEALAISSRVFGPRAAQPMADAIRRNAMNADEYAKKLDASKGAIERTSKETESFGEKMQVMRNKLDVALAPLGDKVAANLEKVLPQVLTYLDKVIGSWNNIKPEQQDQMIKGLGLLVGAGVGLKVVAGSLEIIAGLATPLGMTFLAVGGLALLYDKVAKKQKEIQAAPPMKFMDLDKVSQMQFTHAASTLRDTKNEKRTFDAAQYLGVTSQDLVDASILDKDSKLLIADQAKLLDGLVAVWQGKGKTFAAQVAGTSKQSGKAIVDTMAEGAASSDSLFQAVLKAFDTIAKKLFTNSDAKSGPFSHLTANGRAIIETLAQGASSSNALYDAILGKFGDAGQLLPHSDAKSGPFSHLTNAGRAIDKTIADGLLSSDELHSAVEQTFGRAGERMEDTLSGHLESMARRMAHNARLMRDDTENVWWQTASIPGAAMRYGVDSALGALDDAKPAKLALTLDADQMKLVPDNLKDLFGNKVQEQLKGPLSLELDAELKPNLQNFDLQHLVDEQLAAMGPLTLSGALKLDAIEPEPFTSAIDRMVESMGGLQLAGQTTADAMGLSLGQISSAATETGLTLDQTMIDAVTSAAGTGTAWERLKNKTTEVWGKIVATLERSGIDMTALTRTTGAGINSETEKAFSTLLVTHGVTAEQAKAIWEQLGVDITGETQRTFKTMQEVIDKFQHDAQSTMNKLVTDVSMKLITGEGDWNTILKTALNSMLKAFIEMAVGAVLACEAVQTAIQWMWSPIGALIIAGALATLLAIQSNWSKDDKPSSQAKPLADGGIVTKPTFALIGEAGPEAVIPLRSSKAAGYGGGDIHVHVDVHGNHIMSDRDVETLTDKIQRKTVEALRRENIRARVSYA